MKELINNLDFKGLIENAKDEYTKNEIIQRAMEYERKKAETEKEYINKGKVHDIKYGRCVSFNVIEKNILSVIINNSNLWESFKSYGDIFQDKDCKHLYQILLLLFNDIKINKNILKKHVIDNKCYSYSLLSDIIESDKSEENYELYLEKLLTGELKKKLLSYFEDLSKNKLKTLSVIKSELIKKLDSVKMPYEKDLENIREICKRSLNNLYPETIKSTIDFFDINQGGFVRGDFVFIGARPGQGKSSYSRFLTIELLKNKSKVGLFASENGKDQTTRILACNKAMVNENLVTRREATKEDEMKIANGYSWIYDSVLMLDDSSEYLELEKKFMVMIKKGLEIVMIDHLHHLYVRNWKQHNIFSRKQELDFIIGRLKAISKKYKIVLIVFGQLHRKEAGIPTMNDVKDTGNVEEYFNIMILMQTLEAHLVDDAGMGIVDFHVVKNRYGKVDHFKRIFNKPLSRFDKF